MAVRDIPSSYESLANSYDASLDRHAAPTLALKRTAVATRELVVGWPSWLPAQPVRLATTPLLEERLQKPCCGLSADNPGQGRLSPLVILSDHGFKPTALANSTMSFNFSVIAIVMAGMLNAKPRFCKRAMRNS